MPQIVDDIESLTRPMFHTRIHTQGGYTVRYETLQGRRHIIAPVVMMVEGVHHGNQGLIYTSAEELSSWPVAWNGIPIAVDHPSINGQRTSCNNPGVLESNYVGRVFNSHWDGKLRGETWFDLECLKAVSPQVLSALLDGRPLDVSTGSFPDIEMTPGEWHGEQYVGVAKHHRPDHLAVLIADVHGAGACSYTDGCGIRVQKGGETLTEAVVKDIDGQPLAVTIQKGDDNRIVTYAQGYREVMQALQTELDRMDNQSKIHFLVEVYSDHAIYEVQQRSDEGGGEFELYKQSYEKQGEKIGRASCRERV